MRILYVLHQFFPLHYTGTERLTLQIAKQIQRLGHYVSVLTYEPNNVDIQEFQKLDYYVMKKEYQVGTIPVTAFKTIDGGLGLDYVFDPHIEKYLHEIVKKFDIVHFTHTQRFGSVFKICKDLGVPTVLTLTDNWLLCPVGLLTRDFELCDGPDEGRKCISVCKYDDKFLTRYRDAKFFFENVDRVFSGSEFVRSTFAENDWHKNIELNTFSVDYSYVKPLAESKDLIFGFIGSLMWHKGLHILIEAFKKVKDHNIKLKIYGAGAEGNQYANSVLELIKEDERIEYAGTFEYKDLPSIMKDISVMVIPSTYKEIYPLVMQTSLAYKKPVIATKVGGMPEVIEDGVNGYLFDIGDIDQLSKIISTIVGNPNHLDILKKNIKLPPRVEEEAFVYERAYRELIRDKPH